MSAARPDTEECFVYVMEMECGTIRPVKVGISSNPDNRLRAIQTSSPFPVRIVATLNCHSRQSAHWIESCLHDAFSEERLSGEWFDADATAVSKTMRSITRVITYCGLQATAPRHGEIDAETAKAIADTFFTTVDGEFAL